MITIALTPTDRGGQWFASLDGADVAGPWCNSPESATAGLLDKLRGEYRSLADRATRRHDVLSDEEQALLLWLVGLFG